jgi:glucose/arabinose dehydrogenase
LLAASIAGLGAPGAGAGSITPDVLVPDYTISLISSGVASANIAQLAFDPDDPLHLYAVQTNGTVSRYDYDPATGTLSNALIVRSGLGQSLGLAFWRSDLFVSMDLGGSVNERPGDGRISRLSDRDATGVFQTRHDFVHSIPKGNHDVNQLQIVGDTLWTGIGAVGRTGDPAQENVYTMTIARIVDLKQVDWSGPIDADFKGSVNYLASETEWVNTSGSDGQLRYYASGFRNPFGIAVDADGDVWASSNGNSDTGFLSPDYLYKKIPLGGQGQFPPASFGWGPPHISGTPVQPLANMGQNPAVTGLDFVPIGDDQGHVVLAQAGATNQTQFPVGKDVMLVDPDSGAFQILVDDMDLPTDVVADPYGRLLVSDLADGSVWLLTVPSTGAAAGRIPDGDVVAGSPLRLSRGTPGNLELDWDASCASGDNDYIVYEGTLGIYYDHEPVICTTGGVTAAVVAQPEGPAYYLVVPRNADNEGSYGARFTGWPRPASTAACLPQFALPVCP